MYEGWQTKIEYDAAAGTMTAIVGCNSMSLGPLA